MWLVLASIADVLTTWLGLRRGAVELNPIYGTTNIVPKAILLNAVFLGAVFLITRDPAMWNIVAAARAVPVVWNLYQLWRT